MIQRQQKRQTQKLLSVRNDGETPPLISDFEFSAQLFKVEESPLWFSESSALTGHCSPGFKASRVRDAGYPLQSSADRHPQRSSRVTRQSRSGRAEERVYAAEESVSCM